MDIGLVTFSTDYGLDPVTLGRAAEERGFESLFLTEHTHIPTSRLTPRPGGGELPKYYSHIYDPFVALSMVAAVTERLLVGTAVCLVIERDPIVLAKEVASLDRLSGGRFVFGVGAGWNREEMANHGTDPKTRMALLTERIQAMRQIWTQNEAEFHGRFVDFDPIWSWPKPIQQPHPPILVGGTGPTVLDRVLDYGDGWIPLRVTLDRLDDVRARIDELNGRAAEAGRGPIPVTVYGAVPTPEALEAYRAAGIGRVLLSVPNDEPKQALQTVDEYAELLG